MCQSLNSSFLNTFEMIIFLEILLYLLPLSFVITIPIPQKDQTLPKFTIIEILKQIHKVNCDGSYSLGFKASDGTFLVEQKDADGYVTGKFGGYANVNRRFHQLSEYISDFNIARQFIGFPFPATIENQACDNSNISIVLKTLGESGTEMPIEMELKDPTQVQKTFFPEVKKQNTPNRPFGFFKFGEALFRSPSNASEYEMFPNLSKIDKFIQDLKTRKLYPSND